MKIKSFRKKLSFILSPSSMIRTYRGVSNARKILDLGNYNEKCRELGLELSKGEDIWKHYKNIGVKHNIIPCELFDPIWYKERYLASTPKANPLLHYLVIGERKGHYTTATLAPKAEYNAISQIVPKHKSYLLALMEQYRIKSIDLALSDPNFASDTDFTDSPHIASDPDLAPEKIVSKKEYTYHLVDGPSYLTKQKIKFNFILKTSIQDDNCLFYLENPFFGFKLPYFTTFSNVKILTNTTNIHVDDHTIVNDELFYSIKIEEQYGRALKQYNNQRLCDDNLIIDDMEDSSFIIEDGIHLTKEYNENYFHFIYEVAVKLNYIDENNIFDKKIPVLISGNLHENILSLLKIINTNKRKIIKLEDKKLTHVKNLYYLSDLTLTANAEKNPWDKNVTILPDKIIKSLQNKVLNELSFDSSFKKTFGDKIYISRKKGIRKAVNEPQIEKILSQNGYTIIDIETLTFVEQVILFSKAKTIISPSGASMANLLWCASHTKVIILYPDHPRSNTSFWEKIAKINNIDLTILKGEVIGNIDILFPHSDYEINLDVLKKII